MEKQEKSELYEEMYRRIGGIVREMREDLLANIRMDIVEARNLIWEVVCEMERRDIGDVVISRAVAGIPADVLNGLINDCRSGIDFDEAAEKIPMKEISAFLGTWKMNMEILREKYPNAYTSWTREQDDRLEALWAEGRSYEDLEKELGRNSNAIKIRVVKLELEDKYGEREEGRLVVHRHY